MQYRINKSREERKNDYLKGSNNAYLQLLQIPFFNELYEAEKQFNIGSKLDFLEIYGVRIPDFRSQSI